MLWCPVFYLSAKARISMFPGIGIKVNPGLMNKNLLKDYKSHCIHHDVTDRWMQILQKLGMKSVSQNLGG